MTSIKHAITRCEKRVIDFLITHLMKLSDSEVVTLLFPDVKECTGQRQVPCEMCIKSLMLYRKREDEDYLIKSQRSQLKLFRLLCKILTFTK